MSNCTTPFFHQLRNQLVLTGLIRAAESGDTLCIDGILYNFQLLPTICFGREKRPAHIFNPNVASTPMASFVFYVNYGYCFFSPNKIYHAPFATCRLELYDIDPKKLKILLHLNAETFRSCAIR